MVSFVVTLKMMGETKFHFSETFINHLIKHKTMRNNRGIILGILIIVSFALLIFSISLYLNYQHEIRQESRLNPESLDNMTVSEIKEFLEEKRSTESAFKCFYFLPFIAFVGLLVGTVVFYIMSDKVIHQRHSLQKNAKIILNFLNPHEKKVIETLIENEGKARQYELSHLPGLNKVKTHRILLNLEQKGIIHKEKLGKINKIVLDKELYEVLK